jgi:putative endonuclease
LTHLENVISTGATDGFIVRRAVEKPALSEVEWDPRISLLYSPCHNPSMVEQAYVYILSSTFKKLYIGITTEIELRTEQHKAGRFEGSFTSKSNIDKLVYFERFTEVTAAIAREKQLKRWSRIKKIRLIVAQNPTWKDLSEDWGKPITPFTEPKPKHPEA